MILLRAQLEILYTNKYSNSIRHNIWYLNEIFNHINVWEFNVTYKKFSLGFENITVIYEVGLQSYCSLGYI